MTITFDEKPLPAYEGEMLAAALLAHGIRALRETGPDRAPRGLYCAIGHCFECQVVVNGQSGCSRLPDPSARRDAGRLDAGDCRCAKRVPGRVVKADVCVIGAGPAGLAASSILARYGRRVVVVDESPEPGGRLLGQLHRVGRRNDAFHQDGWWHGCRIAAMLAEEAQAAGAAFLQGASVWGIYPGWRVCVSGDEPRIIDAERVVIATGASEVPLPIPGWTLPGVMTIGAGAGAGDAASGAAGRATASWSASTPCRWRSRTNCAWRDRMSPPSSMCLPAP